MFERKHLSCSPKAGSDFVENQKHLVVVAELPEPNEIVRRVKAHSSCTLYYRFNNHCGNLSVVAFKLHAEISDILVGARVIKSAGGHLSKVLLLYCSLEERVHACNWIADRHGGKGVAVIA